MKCTTKFINLTPHPICVENTDGELITFPTSGIVARVSVDTVYGTNLGGFKISFQVFGDVEGIPEAIEGTVYIVSAMVKARTNNRSDVVAPDTGDSAIRNKIGHICHVTGFIV